MFTLTAEPPARQSGTGPKSVAEFTVTRVQEIRSIFRESKADRPEEIARFWRTHIPRASWYQEDKELLIVVTLNTKLNVTGFNLVSMGSVNESLAHPREILRPVIVSASYGFVLIHNHPSGDPTPSDADHRLTRRIREGAELLNVKLFDHVIIGDYLIDPSHKGYWSFREAGVI